MWLNSLSAWEVADKDAEVFGVAVVAVVASAAVVAAVVAVTAVAVAVVVVIVAEEVGTVAAGVEADVVDSTPVAFVVVV